MMIIIITIIIIFKGSTTLVSQGFLLFEVPQSNSDTPHSVGLLWTSDRLVAETSALTTRNNHNRQTFMIPTGFEPAIPASERPQTDTLDRAVTGFDPQISQQKEITFLSISVFLPSPREQKIWVFQGHDTV